MRSFSFIFLLFLNVTPLWALQGKSKQSTMPAVGGYSNTRTVGIVAHVQGACFTAVEKKAAHPNILLHAHQMSSRQDWSSSRHHASPKHRVDSSPKLRVDSSPKHRVDSSPKLRVAARHVSAPDVNAPAPTPLKIGDGLFKNQKVWIEKDGLLKVIDAHSGEWLLAGPAFFEFISQNRIKLYRGSLKLVSNHKPLFFETAFTSGNTEGVAAVWSSSQNTQALSLEGNLKVWHPYLTQAVVLVKPGFFTESSYQAHYLQPRRPSEPDLKRMEDFLVRFHDPSPIVKNDENSKSQESTPAANPTEVGTRDPKILFEPKREENSERLLAKITGKDFEEEEDLPLVVAGQRMDAYGMPLHKQRSPAQKENVPEIEIRKTGKKTNEEQREFLKRIQKIPQYDE